MAVLRSGSPWLPVDPALPEARRRFMIGDADAAVVLGRAGHDRALAGGHRDMLREPSVRRLAEAVQQSIDSALNG